MKSVALDLTNPADRLRYDRLFDACPHAFIQQSSLWADVIREIGPDQPIFLIAHDGGQDLAGLPLYLYQHPRGNVLNSVPQPGPLGGVFARRDLSEEQRRDAYCTLLEHAVDIAGQHHCLAATFITNPFADDLDLYEAALQPSFIFENFTQFIALGDAVVGGEVVTQGLSRNLSRNLRKAQEFGFTVEDASTPEELRAWYDIHARRHRELGVEPLDARLLENIYRLMVPAGRAKLLLVKHGETIASGCFYIHHQDVVDVFILSINAEFDQLGPNFLNTYASLQWAAGSGAEIYNWQSSPNRGAGVYRYKEQWGSQERPYYFVTKLLVEPKEVQQIGLDVIRHEYKGHYVVPFAAFSQGFDQVRFSK